MFHIAETLEAAVEKLCGASTSHPTKNYSRDSFTVSLQNRHLTYSLIDTGSCDQSDHRGGSSFNSLGFSNVVDIANSCNSGQNCISAIFVKSQERCVQHH
mmetsp:Transcript_9261/g.20266  ORF Transcript_9261/g.20266 Transcript_9261/m.20266 type:complete len:100 (+) Transcript_9261:3-302(+)